MKYITKSIAAIALITSLQSCGQLPISNKHALLNIEKDMTKSEVSKILGTPDYRRFDEDIEQWEYVKGENYMSYGDVIIVDFKDGRVVNLNSYKNKPVAQVAQVEHIDRGTPGYIERSRTEYRYDRRYDRRIMDENEFRSFYNRVKSAPFRDEQFKIVSFETANRFFTSRQSRDLIAIYNFDDERLKMLDILAPKIVDRENSGVIVDIFTFSSGKDKARDILLNSKGKSYNKYEEGEFSALLSKIKRAPFKDEKFEVIARSASKGRFTCSQCARIMSIFSFDDDKLKVVELLQNSISDPANYRAVINVLTFESSKEKAKNILTY